MGGPVGSQAQRGEAELYEAGQLLGHGCGRAGDHGRWRPGSLADMDLYVIDAGDLPGIPAGPTRGGQNAVPHRGNPFRRHVPVRRDPAVRQPSGHGQCPVAEGAQPDWYPVGGLRFYVGGLGAVEAARERELSLRPQAPGDENGLRQAVDLIPWGGHTQAERTELLVRIAAAEAEDQPPAREPVQRLGHLGHDGRRPVWHSQHAGSHPDPRGSRRDPGQQGPGFVRWLRAAGMIGCGDEIEAKLLCPASLGYRAGTGRRRGGNSETDKQLSHASSLLGWVTRFWIGQAPARELTPVAISQTPKPASSVARAHVIHCLARPWARRTPRPPSSTTVPSPAARPAIITTATMSALLVPPRW